MSRCCKSCVVEIQVNDFIVLLAVSVQVNSHAGVNVCLIPLLPRCPLAAVAGLNTCIIFVLELEVSVTFAVL